MKKTLGLAAAAAVVLPIVVPAAAMADSSPVNTFPGLGAQQQIFNTGGGDLGRGAAELVDSTVIGAPQVVTVIPCELVGLNAPAPCGYTDQNNN
jgi:hypothetical protein